MHSHVLHPRPHPEHRAHLPLLYKTRWFLGVLLAVGLALVLVALRAVAPIFVQRYENEQLADLPGYSGDDDRDTRAHDDPGPQKKDARGRAQ